MSRQCLDLPPLHLGTRSYVHSQQHKIAPKVPFPSRRTPLGFSPLVLASWLASYSPQIPPRIVALNPSKSCRNSDIAFSSFYARWVANILYDWFARYFRICSHTRLDSAKRRPWTLLQHLRSFKALPLSGIALSESISSQKSRTMWSTGYLKSKSFLLRLLKRPSALPSHCFH